MPSPLPTEPADRVREDLAATPFRQPVVETINPGVNRDWNVITEAARRAILVNPDARSAAVQFNTVPVSETLPAQAVEAIAAADERTARLAKKMEGSLGKMLRLPEVPDELLKPDITNAASLVEARHYQGPLERAVDSEEDYDMELGELRRRVDERPGISRVEKGLVANRYRYARDVKMLGLMAELNDQPFDNDTESNNGILSHQLQSGTTLVMSEEAFRANPKLLDPGSWQSRRQLKDRVHVITVDGQEYMLKERKTPRHTDTKQNGHKDGLTSQQEFEVATKFAKMGEVRTGDISVVWERPLGYVEFPDGFQFCVFEKETDILESPLDFIKHGILVSREEYEDEYQAIKQRAKQLYDEREDLLIAAGPKSQHVLAKPKKFPLRRRDRRYKKWHEEQPEADELTFEEFAKLKATHMVHAAQALYMETVLGEGYVNSDQDGYAYKVSAEPGKRVGLEVVGFDFEYYLRWPKKARTMLENGRRAMKNGSFARSLSRHQGSRPVKLAGSYAMLESMGMKLPPPKEGA